MKKPLGFRLEITDEARALMEERMILDTDVLSVMEHYRESGEAVLENDTGLLVTRHRIGNVTFWGEVHRGRGGLYRPPRVQPPHDHRDEVRTWTSRRAIT